MRYFILFFTLLGIGHIGYAQEIRYETIENISYVDETAADYAKEQCKLDIHYPISGANKPVVLWLHGGGLTGGKKEIPTFLKEKGHVDVGGVFPCAPNVNVDDINRHAAKATTLGIKSAGKYRGDTNNVFISGHSAGGYMALLITLNNAHLEHEGLDADKLAGIIPFSAQTI